MRVPTEAEEQKRAIHRQREQLVQARKRLEAPVITSVYRQSCGRCGNIANDVQPPRGRLQRQTTQAARWWFPAGGLLGPIQIRLTDRACDNSHNRSQIFVLDRLNDVPRLIEHLYFRARLTGATVSKYAAAQDKA